MSMKTKTVLLISLIAAASLVSAAAAPVKTEGGSGGRDRRGRPHDLSGYTFRCTPRRRFALASSSARGKMAGGTSRRQVRACVYAGRCRLRGMAERRLCRDPAPSEDCLYLNVWTPANAATDRLPVLVWIYGGGFVFDATSVPLNSGEQLAKKRGGVRQHRVSRRSMGFMAHPGLTAESKNHSSGNYGVLDMIAGLKWVHKNIAAFGGNPGKVTIMGESAGGIAVSPTVHIAACKGRSKERFQRAGAPSGRPVDRDAW